MPKNVTTLEFIMTQSNSINDSGMEGQQGRPLQAAPNQETGGSTSPSTPSTPPGSSTSSSARNASDYGNEEQQSRPVDLSDTTPTVATSHGGARILGTPDSMASSEGPGPYLMLADTLTGNDVDNFADEKLGDVKGIMLDVQRGRIAYAVLSVGGFLGLGDRLFAIPWSALTLDTANERFLLDVDKEALKNAPGFDKDQWPSMADYQWASQIHSYYRAQPYWDQH